MLTKTDHSEDIAYLRREADRMQKKREEDRATFPGLKAIHDRRLAADLLEAHDQQGISLDHWTSARLFIIHFTRHQIQKNGV